MTLSRRKAVCAIGLVLAAPFTVGVAHAQGPSLVPPGAPMRFSRKLTRELSDGKLIEVSRVFEIRFSPLGEGFRIDGQQIGVEVHVPPGLEQLAELERSRDESALFPILLGSDGTIMGLNQPASGPQIDQAVKLALAKLDGIAADGQDTRDAAAFLRALHNSAAETTNNLPPDLFFPAAGEDFQTRSLPLPDGTIGQIKIAFVARIEESSGLLRNASRTIETSVGNSTRTSVERWQLALQ
ncbi:MAG: hypothetical protein WAT93_10595 [Pontixanthobacter sp.]